MIDQADGVRQGARASQLTEGATKELARQCALVGTVHHHAAQAGQNTVPAVRLKRLVIKKRTLQQSPLHAQTGNASQIKAGFSKRIPQADDQAPAFLGGSIQQVTDSFFGRFRNVLGVVSFAEEQINQEEQEPNCTQGKSKLVIETERGEHGLASNPSLNTGCL